MRRSAFILSSMVLMLASAAVAKQTKVDVCHMGSGTISVAASAVPAHVGHGDTACACAVIDDCAAQGGDLDETTCECVIDSPACEPAGVCDETGYVGCNGYEYCACGTDTSGNGVCMDTGVDCLDVTACPNGQSDCPVDTVCVVATCCEDFETPDICAPLCPPAP